jgi:DNA adenine methylase
MTATILNGDEMKITALAPWFGAKRNLAAEIVAELGDHRIYWEPFCGSCAILLAKPSCVMETVNDLNGDIVNLARVIIDAKLGPQLYRRLRRTLMCEQLHRDAADRRRTAGYGSDKTADLDAAYDYFLCSWLGRSGTVGTQSYNQGFCLRFTANGGHAATRWASAVDSIPAWKKRIRNVTILCRDAFELLPRIDDADGLALYIDPPYLRKGAKYTHDFSSDDHARLAEQLQRFKHARVVVSYYDEPELAVLYPNWTVRPLKATKSLVSQGQRDSGGAIVAPEVLLLNGPSLATNEGRLF